MMEKRQHQQVVESSAPVHQVRPQDPIEILRWTTILVLLILVGLIIGAAIVGIMSIADLVHGHPGETWQHVTAWLQSNLWWLIALPIALLVLFKAVVPHLNTRMHTALERAEAGKIRAQTRALNHAIRHNKKNMPQNRYIALSDELGNYPQMIDAERTDYLLPGNVPGGNANINPQQLLKFVERMRTKIEQGDDPQKQIAAPQEGIPAIVRYSDVEDEVPDGMSLLGIHPSNGDLELTSWEKLKALWLVGSSSTGKSNTIFGKAREARKHGAKLAVIDQHATKPDSLARKLEPFKDAFVRPLAVTDEQVLATLAWFKAEFERRVHCPTCARGEQCPACTQKVVLICDEMNRMCRNEALIKPLREIVEICGEESRGFGMYGWFLSQKCAGLKWLRDSAITVIAHRLTRFEEALLACNDDRKAAKNLLEFKVGRSYIYGVDFDEPIELQQPLYEVEGTVSASVSSGISELSPTDESGYSSGDTVDEPGKQLDTEPDEFLTQAQKMKLLKVLELDAQGSKGQNEIIRTIWGQEPNTRAGQAAVEELRLIRAYIAQDQRRKLGL